MFSSFFAKFMILLDFLRVVKKLGNVSIFYSSKLFDAHKNNDLWVAYFGTTSATIKAQPEKERI